MDKESWFAALLRWFGARKQPAAPAVVKQEIVSPAADREEVAPLSKPAKPDPTAPWGEADAAEEMWEVINGIDPAAPRYGKPHNGVVFDRTLRRYVVVNTQIDASISGGERQGTTESVEGDAFEDFMQSVASRIGGKWLHAKIGGASFLNEDGSSRQELIAGLEANQQLFFATDFDNPHDANAVRLMTGDKNCVGFVPSWLNKDIAATIRAKNSPICLVKSVNGSIGNVGAAIGIAWVPVEFDDNDVDVEDFADEDEE